jgi:hypothetical protein
MRITWHDISRTSLGELPSSAWPEDYPVAYVDTIGELICFRCARDIETSENIDNVFTLVGHIVLWEPNRLVCSLCDEHFN